MILDAYREWDLECSVKRLNGMFALATVRFSIAERLILARDRAGEKPLFYRTDGRAFAFASELKALFVDPRFDAVDRSGGARLLPGIRLRAGRRCLVRGIQKLPQGHAMTFDLRARRGLVGAYWSLPANRCRRRACQTSDLVDELDRLLADSVRMRLIADVPVGVMLSGGIDSSLVTAMAARMSSRRVKTFTISFPGHGAFDESPYARAGGASTSGPSMSSWRARRRPLICCQSWRASTTNRIADSSMVPTYLVSRLIRREATVALGGDGGDELFGGYPHHSWVQQQTRMGGWCPRPARWAGRTAATRLMPVGTKGRNYLLGITAATRRGTSCSSTSSSTPTPGAACSRPSPDGHGAAGPKLTRRRLPAR